MLLKKSTLLLIVIFLLGAVLRFSYLTWGYPFFFHPDENNITNAIMQLSPTSLNPHFFAYGGLPIYITYLVSFLMSRGHPTFSFVGYTLRFISALLSCMSIVSLFYIGKRMFDDKVGMFAAMLASVSIGFIQFAHFGTFEMWLSFLTLWLLYMTFLLYKNPSEKIVLITGIVSGALLSVKVSGAIFIFIPLGVLLLRRHDKRKCIQQVILYCLLVAGMYTLTNPYFFLDNTAFLSSLSYESSVALGTLPVFYTQTFLHTIPILFQFTKIYPFLLNPFIEFTFIASFLFVFWTALKRKQSSYILLILFFFITFFSQAFLFVKWTRYMVPTLPIIYLMCAITLSKLRKLQLPIFTILFIISTLYAFAFLITVYPTDSRIAANTFAHTHVALRHAIVEPYDLGAIAFSNTFPTGKIINLYDLDTDPSVQLELAKDLPSAQIFLSPSQRLMNARLQNAMDFPKGNMLYTDLFSGTLGFHSIYQTPCNFWCMLVYTGNPRQSLEDTASVFDHPIVTIFSKK